MKHIVDHDMTEQLLSRWAGSQKELVVCSFYFWSAGTTLQKSQEGLFRSLLYEVLRSDPSLAAVIAPELCDHSTNKTDVTLKPWHLSTLQQAMNRLLKCATSKRFCFFVDGLDEYDGDLTDLLSLLQNTHQRPHVKFCVSSRPRNILRDSFDTKSKTTFCLEDFTAEDMRKFVTESLRVSPTFRKLDKTSRTTREIVNIAVTKAQGVFLWVSHHPSRHIPFAFLGEQVNGRSRAKTAHWMDSSTL